MISEEQQDQAAPLRAGLLGADEDAAFESELRANAELRDLVRELREAAGDLALTAPSLLPPASLKERVMGVIAMETKRVAPMPTRRASFGWVPWAIAAALACFAACWLSIAYGWSASLPKHVRPIR
jgi:anti-sigma-K factor RskA